MIPSHRRAGQLLSRPKGRRDYYGSTKMCGVQVEALMGVGVVSGHGACEFLPDRGCHRRLTPQNLVLPTLVALLPALRRDVSLRLRIPSRRTRPLLPRCRGTSPNQAANSRPDLNARGSPVVAPAPRRGEYRGLGPLHDRCSASPPRPRGIIELSTADSGVHRFTPAPARNCRNRALRRQTPPPHPRSRGNTDVPLC